MSTGFVHREEYHWYDMGKGPGLVPPGRFAQPGEHLDDPATRQRLQSLIQVSGLIAQLDRIDADEATHDDLFRVHTADYLETLEQQDALPKGGFADPDVSRTPFGPGNLAIARLSAGGVLAAARAVTSGAVDNAYALVRPPGHHAVRDRGMGLCVFANVAVAIESVRHDLGVERVAVIDWDVHHGNGTQDIYWNDPDVLTVSLHEDRLFPLSIGAEDEQGGPDAWGSCINVPLPPGSGSQAYRKALRRIVIPQVSAFRPDLIIVASGYDASFFDPNGHMLLTVEDYRWMAESVRALAEDVCDGRLVFAHEGGYSPWYVPYCALAVVEALSGVRTGVGDPVARIAELNPNQVLTPEQERAIDTARCAAEAAGAGRVVR
ncbi:hypothetical protein BAY59_27160 [Prauserella coralliicola]|nr:hypothetical protein BAY59_27160 [Prauserella coralliicola]